MTLVIAEKKIRVPNKKLLTYDDYARLTPPDSGNYELHKGQIVFMPTPIPKHQLISGELHILLGSHIKKHQLGKLIAAPMDTQFSKHEVVQPDLLFISKNRISIIGSKKIEGVPDFIVEIKSPGNTAKEMSYKKHLYETYGVKEYWVIYPEKNIIKQFENREEEFVLVKEAGLNDTLQSIVIEGFNVNINEVFS